MTKLEKAMRLDPNKTKEQIVNGCDCPSEVLGIPFEACGCKSCDECWDEEYSGEEARDGQGEQAGTGADDEPVSSES